MTFGLVCTTELVPVLSVEDGSDTLRANVVPSNNTPSHMYLRDPIASTSSQISPNAPITTQPTHGWPGMSIPVANAPTASYSPLPPIRLPPNGQFSPIPLTQGFGGPRNDLLAGTNTVDAHIVDWNGGRAIMFVFGVRSQFLIPTFLF
jgi:hypothetical protein